jgi:AGZA family xanthine/uracil permease-like MFS transporter
MEHSSSGRANVHPKWFVRGDIDGFFGLFIDNLLQLMLITALCTLPFVGLPAELVVGTILPGAAISILAGNLFYSWQAYRLARRTGRDDVCALPYGINTVSLFAYVFFIMAPVYAETKNPKLVWQMGLAACFLGAILELIGAFVGDALRRVTPRAALLSALAGVAITFISMGSVFRIFAMPVVAFVPMMIVLAGYAGRVRWPLGLPSGLMAVLLGAALAWGWPGWHPPNTHWDFHVPSFVGGDLWAALTHPFAWNYLSVIFPMALFNVIGSLQNLESAEAAGDRYETRSSLLANGLGSVAAALLGSPFNTTLYIGHPGWKAMGARLGYSALNGVVITILCLVGGVALVEQLVPLEATLGILLWIGVIITAQAFQEVPKAHGIAVAVGLVPCLAAWAFTLVEAGVRAGGSNLIDAEGGLLDRGIYLHGLISLSQGSLLTSMVLAASIAFVIDKRFYSAAIWMAAGAVLAFFGLTHGYELTETGVHNRIGWAASPALGGAYAASALLFLICERRKTAVEAN